MNSKYSDEHVENLGKTTITEKVNQVVNVKMNIGDQPPLQSVQAEIIERLLTQTVKGVKKYGDVVQHNNLSAVEWIDHAIEESMDQITYLTMLKHTLQGGIDQ